MRNSPPVLLVDLTIEKSTHLEDWYVLRREFHDGASGVVPTQYGSKFVRSDRLDESVDVEGTRDEWIAIMRALDDHGAMSFRRCAVAYTREGVEVESPRNSDRPVLIKHGSAKHLADNIRQVLKQGLWADFPAAVERE